MKPVVKSVLLILLLLPALTGIAAAQADPPEDLQAALTRLTTAVERLVVMLEQREARELAENNARQVAVAVDILQLRYRKIERIEEEIRDIEQEESYFPESQEMLNAEIERVESQGRSETGDLEGWARVEIESMELRIGLEAERIKSLREKKLLLENDLAAEQRRLTAVEAILDEWLDSL